MQIHPSLAQDQTIKPKSLESFISPLLACITFNAESMTTVPFYLHYSSVSLECVMEGAVLNVKTIQTALLESGVAGKTIHLF